jgi:Tfp pilus assembly protein FimT
MIKLLIIALVSVMVAIAVADVVKVIGRRMKRRP